MYPKGHALREKSLAQDRRKAVVSCPGAAWLIVNISLVTVAAMLLPDIREMARS
jgi:hypothetical protein